MIAKRMKNKKKLDRKKMSSIIVYGFIFLVSTIAYYFMNTSIAQNIIQIDVSVIDEENKLDIYAYELKVPEEKEGYMAELAIAPNDFKAKSFTSITPEEFEERKNGTYQDENKEETKIENTEKVEETSKNEKAQADLDPTEINQEETVKASTNEEEESTKSDKNTSETKQEEEKQEENKKEETETVTEERKRVKVEAGEKLKLTEEQVESKKIYLVAQYDHKEVDGKVYYNKVLTKTADKSEISVSGYMPKDAQIVVKKVDKTSVEDAIKESIEDADKNINLTAAYDIKIKVDQEEFEPEDIDESVNVSITGIDGNKVKVWHLDKDNKIEIQKSKKENKTVKFQTGEFSIYGIEVLEESNDEAKTDNAEDAKEKSSASVKGVSNQGEPKRAPNRDLGDSTFEINDYTSDYYYYRGMNYTENITGENTNNYPDNKLIKVTLNYHGFAKNETDPNKKGRISLEETEDIVKHIRCAPIQNGSVSLELMLNPFMDKPTGYGFGGWTAETGSIATNTNTKVQTLTVSASSEITINLYANWETASVVYVNPDTGSDNGLYDGLSEEEPFGSWGKAFEYLSSHNQNDREKNIIVLTGNIDTGINYTRPVTKTITRPATVTFSSSTTFTTGTTYLLATGTGNNANAIMGADSGVGNAHLSTNTLPPDEAGWILATSRNGYTIRNAATGKYLSCNDNNGNLTLSTTATEWRYSNRRFYYYGSYYDYYLRYNNGWTTSTSQYNGTQFYFLTYTAVIDENADPIETITKGSLGNNSYYTSTTNSIPVTVTSLYNHTDYRPSATMSLTTANYLDFDIYKDFQMNHVSISATGYTSNDDGTTFSSSYPNLMGNAKNVRLGRGIQCANATSNGGTFANIIGGDVSVGSTSNDNNAYQLVVESGKYSSIQGFNYYGNSTRNYYGTIYLVLGNDIDRKNNQNSDMSVYYRTTINSGGGINGKSSIRDKAWLINVKSGKYGTDYFDTYGGAEEDSAYAGIYMGGYGTSTSNNTRDRSDRYLIMEGGLVSNIIGGLKASQNSGVQTKMYIKGGEVYNIVGGAGVSLTYENRFIQITGGKIRYSVSGGSNGVYASSNQNNGRLNGSTLVYIGGDAQIGVSATTAETLYGVQSGCVLGAGNGTSNTTYRATSGQVNTSTVIINDQAHILRNVFGGGNYGVVGTSGNTNGTTKLYILGGTVEGNVYGGANQNNIYGSTAISIKRGQVKGAVYGGSNTSGTISTTTTIDVTGGILGQRSNTTDNEVLFGGGFGSSTTVTGNATVNILDTDADVLMYGSAYGGSSQGRMNSNVTFNIQDLPSNPNTIQIVGNVFAGGKGTSSVEAIIAGDATLNVNGSNLPDASVFGGNDINGATNGNITVNIGETYETKILNIYGGGNLDATGTEADTVKVYLLSHANVTNAFNGGKSANLITGGRNDTTRGIYLQGGHADNIFGGSDTSGTVTASHVYIESGTADNVYGGNNRGGQTTESFVYITGGTSQNVFGGGYLAATPTTNVSLTGGIVTNGFGGGNAANVESANITLDGTVAANIYGGSNSSGTVTSSNVVVISGIADNVFGGNNAGGDTVDTNVLITSEVMNVYGGGNEAITSNSTQVRITSTNITGDVYGGGNGSAAVVLGNSTTRIEGSTTIAGDVFGGGNAAANGSQSNATALVTTLITGGTIQGDVYGAANTSVVYGNTAVKIGTTAVNDNSMAVDSIYIGGTVFGGGKSNTAGSESYDFTFESVTGDANIDINAGGYENNSYTFTIAKSIFGSGNAAKISGYGIVNVSNYGTSTNVKNNISIQRASQVTLDNCWIYLEGTTDTTNEIATAIYTFNRIDNLILKNNTTLYLASGVNIVSKMQSLTAAGAKEAVTIDENGVTSRNVHNQIYLSQGRNIILRTEAGTDGEVYGMAYVGLYKGTTTKEFGIYGSNYTHGSTVPAEEEETFNRNSYVQGKHYSNHQVKVDGFYTNYNIDGVIKTDYIYPTPDDATYYQWIIGKISTDIYYEDIELIATKYATTATHVLNLNGLSYPNMTLNVLNIDLSNLTDEITLNDPDTIPKIASTAEEADSKFGLVMTAGNNGWQTRGSTYFINNEDVQAGIEGRTQYLSDNSTSTPSFSLYLAHSKNISSTAELGTVTIQMQAIYEENEEIRMKNVYIIIKLTMNNTLQGGTDYYEGAITPGKEYDIFPSTTTTITKRSSFSAYYSLFLSNYSQTNYYEGFAGHYYHTLETSCVLPENTKITLIDMSGNTVRYYYYIVNTNDISNNKKIYRFTDFYAMDSTDEHYSADGSYYNSATDFLYEEFIVHVDFEDVTLTDNLENQNIVVQLRDKYDNTVTLTVNNAFYPMLFSVYNDIDVTKRLTLTTNKNIMYMGANLALTIESTYSLNKNRNADIVYDTTHIDNQLGVRIQISSGSDILTAADLEGIYITYKGANYFPRSDGSYRIKIADAVSNVLASMTLNTENGDLETGTYTITAQSFGSIDGTYFSSAIASDSKDIQVVSTNYGFSVDLDSNSVLIEKETGKNKNDSNDLNFTIKYSGSFENPKVVVALYRRKYDHIFSHDYDLVDLSGYVTNTLTVTNVENEYLVTDLVRESQNYTLTVKNTGLTTGTYKVVFTLYDGNNVISKMDKPIIIK